MTQFSFGTVSAAGVSEPPRFRHREAAMDEVIDRTAPNSPEELAIHFLLRHAACRMALTEQAGEETLQQALQHACSGQPQPTSAAVGEPAPSGAAAAAEVTKDDSCAARFSRAYAAARHRSLSAGTSRGTRSAA
ncbi:MAG: hypothetical protein WBG22_08225 [Rhodanobacter sp.]